MFLFFRKSEGGVVWMTGILEKEGSSLDNCTLKYFRYLYLFPIFESYEYVPR